MDDQYQKIELWDFNQTQQQENRLIGVFQISAWCKLEDLN